VARVQHVKGTTQEDKMIIEWYRHYMKMEEGKENSSLCIPIRMSHDLPAKDGRLVSLSNSINLYLILHYTHLVKILILAIHISPETT